MFWDRSAGLHDRVGGIEGRVHRQHGTLGGGNHFVELCVDDSVNVHHSYVTTADLATQTAGVECRKDEGVGDEIPGADKDPDAVVAAPSDLVKAVARLMTLLCVKGCPVRRPSPCPSDG